jgi:Na+-translocating ferredoxin:NAD+ oxidoreductase subunit B
MEHTSYKRLAERLDALPNGFPATPDGIELRLLAKLFTPEEAELASQLRLTLETPQQLAEHTGGDPAELRRLLKQMARNGLIRAGKLADGLGYGLIPFVVGIYENQNERLDPELAALFEAYYLQAFGKVMEVQPALHRVIPVGESIRAGLEVQPYESAAEIIARMQSWGVLDCICRKQKALVGEPCDHPVDVCLAMSTTPGAFDQADTVRALTRQEALETLHRAAEAGLVHSVSNNQQGTWYICNCCTCSCGVLRGMKDLGIANVIAHSAFLCQVDAGKCLVCGDCLERCQFEALSLQVQLEVDARRCVGCGVCTLGCPEGALVLVARPEEDLPQVPETMQDWLAQRAEARQIDLGIVM